MSFIELTSTAAGRKFFDYDETEKRVVIKTTYDAEKYKKAAKEMRDEGNNRHSGFRKVAHLPFALIEIWNREYKDQIEGNTILDSRNSKLLKKLLDDPDLKYLRTSG